ncbi:MAG TPA: glycosyltransferase family 1 protein [Algoriphagus sp.]|nr:glycosyltransferase family 1 protein [Algoriphagus sp.]
MAKICIDVTNISPGKGGAGGGIATYARNLILGLDELLEKSEISELEIIAIGHSGFLDGLKLNRIQKVFTNVNNQSFFARNYWLHFSLPQFIRRNKINVLHRVIPELPFFKASKYVMTLHDFMFDFYLDNPELKKYLGTINQLKFLFLRFLMRIGVSNHDYILVPSTAISLEANTRFPNKKLAIKVTKLATNSARHIVETSGKRDSEISIGYVAGFYPHKGHLEAIKLMKSLQQSERGKNVKLYLRGSKVYQNYYREVEDLIEKEGLRDKVFMEGFDPNITIQEIYGKYTATLLLSRYEGFGLPVLESQSFSKPVICSDIAVFRENLNTSAIYLKSNPTKEETEELLDKLYDREFLDQLVEKGNANTSQYSWSKTCQETLEVYLKLLSQS